MQKLLSFAYVLARVGAILVDNFEQNNSLWLMQVRTTFRNVMDEDVLKEAKTCAECYLWGGPHVLTFDTHQKWVDEHPEQLTFFSQKSRELDSDVKVESDGTHWLVKTDNVRIQGRYWKLNNRSSLHLLGAIALGGPFLNNNTLVLRSKHGPSQWNNENVLSSIGSELHNEFVSARYRDDSELVSKGRPGTGIEIDLPAGVSLVVNRFRQHLGVKIRMCEQPIAGVAGQCGNLNGDASDDSQEKITALYGGSLAKEEVIFPDKEPPMPEHVEIQRLYMKHIKPLSAIFSKDKHSAKSFNTAAKAKALDYSRGGVAGQCAECFVWGNARVLTFDLHQTLQHSAHQDHFQAMDHTNQKLSIESEGTYWLVKTKSIQIQARYWKTKSATAKHNVLGAVAVSGPFVDNNVLVLRSLHWQTTWNDEEILSTSGSNFSNKYISARYHHDAEKIASSGKGDGIDIQLPGGVSLVLNRWRSHVSIKVRMCTAPSAEVEGQCGNLNGDPSDDTKESILARYGHRLAKKDIIFPDVHKPIPKIKSPKRPFRPLKSKVRGALKMMRSKKIEAEQHGNRAAKHTKIAKKRIDKLQGKSTHQCAACIVWGGAHILTFDAHRKHFMAHPKQASFFHEHILQKEKLTIGGTGTYWLVKTSDIRIQARYWKTKAGNNSLGALAVSGPFLGYNTLTLRSLNGKLTWNDDEILDPHNSEFHNTYVRAKYHDRAELVANGRQGNGIDVHLPKGVSLVVNRWQSHLNVQIRMCGKPVHAVKGQCGNLNGRPEDDAKEVGLARNGPLHSKGDIIFRDMHPPSPKTKSRKAVSPSIHPTKPKNKATGHLHQAMQQVMRDPSKQKRKAAKPPTVKKKPVHTRPDGGRDKALLQAEEHTSEAGPFKGGHSREMHHVGRPLTLGGARRTELFDVKFENEEDIMSFIKQV